MSQVTEIKEAINEWSQDRMNGAKAKSIKDFFSNTNVNEVLEILRLKPLVDVTPEESKNIADIILWTTSKIKETGDLKVQNIYPYPLFYDLPNWP